MSDYTDAELDAIATEAEALPDDAEESTLEPEPEDIDATEEADEAPADDDELPEGFLKKYEGRDPKELLRDMLAMRKKLSEQGNELQALKTRPAAPDAPAAPIQPAPTAEEIAAKRTAEVQAKAKAIYDRMVAQGATPFSEEVPDTWVFATTQAEAELDMQARHDSAIGGLQSTIMRNLAPLLAESAIKRALPGVDVAPSALIATLQGYIPDINEETLAQADLTQLNPLLQMAADLAKAKQGAPTKKRPAVETPPTLRDDAAPTKAPSGQLAKAIEFYTQQFGNDLPAAEIKALAREAIENGERFR